MTAPSVAVATRMPSFMGASKWKKPAKARGAPADVRWRWAPGKVGAHRAPPNHMVFANALSTWSTPAPVAFVPQHRTTGARPNPGRIVGQDGANAAGRGSAVFWRIVSACAAVREGFFWAISATAP